MAVDLPSPPHIIIDAGANIGFSTLALAERYPHARILAIEPECTNARLLRQHTAHLQNVMLVEGALWYRPCALGIHCPNDESWAWRVPESQHATVRAYTVPELLNLMDVEHVDLIKLDIEGAELELFSNVTDWLDAVGTLLIEIHGAPAQQAVERALSAHGFRTAKGVGEKQVWHAATAGE